MLIIAVYVVLVLVTVDVGVAVAVDTVVVLVTENVTILIVGVAVYNVVVAVAVGKTSIEDGYEESIENDDITDEDKNSVDNVEDENNQKLLMRMCMTPFTLEILFYIQIWSI